MDGMHDLGGRQGFGRIRYQTGLPTYKQAWEPRAHAMQALGIAKGIYSLDEYRHAVERMEPRHYLTAYYYERSLTGCATLLVEKGVLTVQELDEAAGGKFPLAAPIGAGRRNDVASPAFAVGDRVLLKTEFVSGHVRLPAYVRGKRGVVVGVSPPFPYPDAAAHALDAPAEPTYDVRFSTTELWPDGSDEAFVHVSVFQSYIDCVLD